MRHIIRNWVVFSNGCKKMIDDKITVIVVTSVLPSHPDTRIIDETIKSIRYHLPNAEIIMQIDGLRDEQIDRREDYDKYITTVLWKCLHEWKNVLPIVFDEFSHQTTMMEKTMELIRTPLMLYVEGDCPLVERKIDWQRCIDFIESGDANTIRFHHEAVIPKEHAPLMLKTKDKFLQTIQWSQRPMLSTVIYYQGVVLPNVPQKTFIEDNFHSVVQQDFTKHGMQGWYKHRLWIYLPDESNIKCSYTTDGREGGRKFTTDDDVWGYK